MATFVTIGEPATVWANYDRIALAVAGPYDPSSNIVPRLASTTASVLVGGDAVSTASVDLSWVTAWGVASAGRSRERRTVGARSTSAGADANAALNAPR